MKLFLVLLAGFLTGASAEEDQGYGDESAVDDGGDIGYDDTAEDYDDVYDTDYYDDEYESGTPKVGTGALVVAATLATVLMF